MNALVEDQLSRMRKMLTSDNAEQWFRENRNSNRFYFGRYTGATPVAGLEKNKKKRDDLSSVLQEIDSTSDLVKRPR